MRSASLMERDSFAKRRSENRPNEMAVVFHALLTSYDDILRDRKVSQPASDADHHFTVSHISFSDDQEVDVGIGCRVAARVRTEHDDPHRIGLIHDPLDDLRQQIGHGRIKTIHCERRLRRHSRYCDAVRKDFGVTGGQVLSAIPSRAQPPSCFAPGANDDGGSGASDRQPPMC